MSERSDALPAAGAAPGTPVHVAIIMDGNGRWAKQRGLPRVAGHRRGAEAVRATVKAAAELGVRYLTLFGFSSENWKRPLAEIDDLMGLLRHYLRGEIAELHRNGVRLRVIGDRERLAPDIVTLIANAEEMTAGNGGLNLIIAFNYGGQDEIARAAKKLAADVAANRVSTAEVNAESFARYLDTAEWPAPDMLIRTSGEYRLSNFMLWQAAYSELVFVDTLWPDFDKAALEAAIGEYNKRERRFGGTDPVVP